MTINAGIILTDVYTSDEYDEGLAVPAGTIYVDEAGHRHKLIKYDSGTATVTAAAGMVVGYVSDTGYGAHTCTPDVSDTDNVGAGVLHGAPVDGGYGWVRLTGPATLTTGLTAGAAGNALTFLGADDGTLDVVAAFTNAVVAFCVDGTNDEIICQFPD